ncbi:MAG: hypothetical protein ACYC09_03005 [Bacteroidota bacterium]
MHPILKREIEVAFSKNAQPVWFRVFKWILFLGGLYLLRNTDYTLWYFLAFLFAGAAVHLLWRFKTKGWTQSWYGWNYEKNAPKQK